MSVWEGLTPPYATIVADPPWHYDERVITYGHDRPALSEAMPYSTMSDDEIARLPIHELAAETAHLYLWTTNHHLWAAREIVYGWGFEPTQVLAWCKTPSGLKPGGTFSPTTEFILFGRRTERTERREVTRAGSLLRSAREAAGLGRADVHRAVRGGKPTGIVFRWEADDCLPTPVDWEHLQRILPDLRDVDCPYVPPPPPREPRKMARVDSTWWQWPVGPHSSKPPAFLDIVETVSPGPYVELFARQPRLGWDHWGHGYETGAA